jgi:hypothetical protein
MQDCIQNYGVTADGTGIFNQADNCSVEPWRFYERVYYPTYPSIIITEDKFGKAFKILQSLIQAKAIKIEKVEKFMETISLIVKEL